MAVARTADIVGVMGEEGQTTARLYSSPEHYWGGQKGDFYLKWRKTPRRRILSCPPRGVLALCRAMVLKLKTSRVSRKCCSLTRQSTLRAQRLQSEKICSKQAPVFHSCDLHLDDWMVELRMWSLCVCLWSVALLAWTPFVAGLCSPTMQSMQGWCWRGDHSFPLGCKCRTGFLSQEFHRTFEAPFLSC